MNSHNMNDIGIFISKIKNKWRVNSLIAASKDDPFEIQNFFENKIGTHALEKQYKNVNIKFIRMK